MGDVIVGIGMWLCTAFLYFQLFPYKFPTEMLIAFVVALAVSSCAAVLDPRTYRRLPAFFCCTSFGVMVFTLVFIIFGK